MELSLTHLLLLAGILLLVFGPTRLPQLGRTIGEAVKEYKKASRLDSPANHTADRLAGQPAEPPPAEIDVTDSSRTISRNDQDH